MALGFAQDCKSSANVVKEVVSACLRRGLFDRQKYDQYQILTSKGIQERYAEATERRTLQKIDGSYLLIAIPKNWINVDNNSEKANDNYKKAGDNTHSKVYKNKLNNINTTTTDAHAIPSDLEIAEYFSEKMKNEDAGTEAFQWVKYNQDRNWDCLPDWKSAADRWIARIK